jgi:Na+-transporting methylmalonyl-CoA/oxaloacetate decarboxylase gamma subunit
MGFRIFQGILDGTLLVFLAILIAYVRVVKHSIQRLVRDKSVAPEHKPEPVAPISEREGVMRQFRSLQEAVGRAADMRARMEILFHDAERWIEDLEQLRSVQPPPAPARTEPQNSFEPAPPPAVPYVHPEPQTDNERIIALAAKGHSVREIAQIMNRGEGEIELILGLSRLSDGRSPLLG